MNDALRLRVLSLRYSSWSIRPWLALTHAGLPFETETVEVDDLGAVHEATDDALLGERRGLGSVAGFFPVLWVGDTPIHESLAICEWAADVRPDAGLWPADVLDRARARALSSEMATGFPNLRTHLSCHPFARVPGFAPDAPTRREIRRVFEIWGDALERSGGPFLFGERFGIVDAMYFPVVTRFRTYDVAVPEPLAAYGRALDALPAVAAWRALALEAPRIPKYDQYVSDLGGQP